jgi:carboxymethylenebutenolidase
VHQLQIVNVEDSPMEVFVFEPPSSVSHADAAAPVAGAARRSASPRPALILLQHLPVGHTGLENDEFTLQTAARFAEHGYVVAVPFLFHWWPKSADMQLKRDESRDDRMCRDVSAAFSLLAQRADVDARAIGAVGHCWGGRVAWLAACHLPELAAAAIFYGGRVTVALGGGPAPIELAAQIRCPIIGFFGDQDQNPTPSDVDAYAAALRAAGVPHTFHRYAEAGHAFQNFPTPDRYRPRASEDAWRKVLAFFAQELGVPRSS